MKTFNIYNIESFAYKCSWCGDNVCICTPDDSKWTAHCMSCENTIGHVGFYDPCANSKFEALIAWNKINDVRYKN